MMYGMHQLHYFMLLAEIKVYFVFKFIKGKFSTGSSYSGKGF